MLLTRPLLPFVLGGKLTEAQRIASNADLTALSDEYNLIKCKMSSLSKSQRDAVERRVEYLVKRGDLELENDRVSLHIKSSTEYADSMGCLHCGKSNREIAKGCNVITCPNGRP